MMTDGETPRSAAVHDMPKDGEGAPDWCHPAKLFIGGLPRETSTQQLRDHFAKHGRVVDCVVMRWSDGRSRGFGYITYDNNDSATDALNTTQSLGGRLVDVKRAVPGTNKLFVGGLPQGVTAAELRTHFATFGPVSDAVVMMDSATGRSRGFGFVCFAPGPEGATAISSALANYDKNQIRGKWVEVKSAAPPQELSKAAAEAPMEQAMPPPAHSLASMMPSPMSVSAMQHYHAAAAAHCMASGLVPPMHHHFLLPHSALMSANAPEFVPDGELIQPEPEMLRPGGQAPATHCNIATHIATPNRKRTPHHPQAATQKQSFTPLGSSSIPQAPVATRLPPGLSLPEPDMSVHFKNSAPTMNPELPVYIDVPQAPPMKEMSCQTDGPSCRSCGAAFGCGGQCHVTRNQLLGLREAFVGAKMYQKEDTTKTSLKAKRVNDKGQRIKASTGGA